MVHMEQTLLPLFPLQVVLFPRTPLPLHIFEDRYKEMIGEVLSRQSEFGVVLASEKGICQQGCTASVEQVLRRYDDGRLDILAMGMRRFEILSLDDDKPYLQAVVRFFDDEEFEPPPAGTKDLVLEAFAELKKASDEDDFREPDWQDLQVSFQIAHAIPELNFRQTLLATRSEAARIQRLAEFLPDYNSRQKYASQARAVAPQNGHAKWPQGLQ